MVSEKQINENVKRLVSIGFCQPKFYIPTVWKYADKMMKRGIELGVVVPHDYGFGKGRYRDVYDDVDGIRKVQSIMLYDPEARNIAEKYDKYLDKREKKTGKSREDRV